jgi:hypothetical protein
MSQLAARVELLELQLRSMQHEDEAAAPVAPVAEAASAPPDTVTDVTFSCRSGLNHGDGNSDDAHGNPSRDGHGDPLVGDVDTEPVAVQARG